MWDALKAATVAMESGDFEMATAIIETAGIKVTNGSLSETFDEFGHKYQVTFGLCRKVTVIIPSHLSR